MNRDRLKPVLLCRFTDAGFGGGGERVDFVERDGERRHQDDGVAELPEEPLVQEVLEPIANKHRLQILKSVSQGSRTFSALSEITELRGGNLLFHVQRLIEAGMIVQRRGRGDYMITEKGFKVLKGVSDVHQLLKP